MAKFSGYDKERKDPNTFSAKSVTVPKPAPRKGATDTGMKDRPFKKC
jgi:hypothetical protein